MPTQPDYSASFAVKTLTDRPEKGSTGHHPDPTCAAPALSWKEGLHLLTWTHFAAGGVPGVSRGLAGERGVSPGWEFSMQPTSSGSSGGGSLLLSCK